MFTIKHIRVRHATVITVTMLQCQFSCLTKPYNKRFLKLSFGLLKDGQIISPFTRNGNNSSGNSFSKLHGSANFESSKLISTPSKVGSPSEQLTSGSRILTPELPGLINNSPIQPNPKSLSQDGRREVSSTASETDNPKEKVQTHTLRTILDSSAGNPHDDISLLSSRRVDPSTVRQVYYFDTLAFAKRLESKGFTREQAEGCAECLVEIISTTLDHQGRHMVSKPQQEIAVQQLMSEIVSVKKDMTLLQKSEFSSLKTETEKMSIELSQVQGHIKDEIVKLKGQFSLDINLERGRAIEAHAENEKKLQQLHNKIETEIANLKTIYEVYRNDVFKYAGGTVIAVGGLILGVLRLWH
ncbi:mitochondrial calcium uniporter regulator 1-like [Physella acuta]|uniref:mitochondrial calcium uniporter regulator 1-like n=1 Tax=Physella acuta TaxID=109671 RepID=UPI0027DB2A2D|nr:mitochondrial calcium uniporter regulator 1-like [Physella acuta]